ncbi:glycosyltransferase [Bifidobacterium sp.]|jgi:rhamnosyltransferase|uniref:glycosyltransferase n=1 Tax=Bifidobacterium sp. TaxID=41200 RepID=UPI0025C6C556|nr:glycosyltransferase [Bifidobacterium sp.]MCI1634766.1 glycosyltransferase [Bifidobacterium sp.]
MDLGIVTFNADLDLLMQSYRLAKKSICHFIIIDNGSHNQQELTKSFLSLPKVLLILNEENRGVAHALNQIVQKSEQLGSKWVLLMDHDSLLSPYLLAAYHDLIPEVEKDVAIICPSVKSLHGKPFANLEKGSGHQIINGLYLSTIERCITSGSCISILHCRDLGYFDEQLFIDEVDYEYAFRVHQSGLAIKRVDNICMLHEVIADDQIKQLHLLHKTIQYHDTSLKRTYYRARNLTYLAKRHTGYRNSKSEISKAIIKIIIFERQKLARLRAVKRGITDGNKMKPLLQEKGFEN